MPETINITIPHIIVFLLLTSNLITLRILFKQRKKIAKLTSDLHVFAENKLNQAKEE